MAKRIVYGRLRWPEIPGQHTVTSIMKPLSAAETEVLQHHADGLGSAEIAASGKTSAQVIKNYTYAACQNLGADNRAHLIAVAFRTGIIR
jgi:DNA-binding NarL/FixJ family response regulator